MSDSQDRDRPNGLPGEGSGESHPLEQPPGRAPRARSDAEFVLVWKTSDPVEAQMLVSALAEEGIPTPGLGRLHGAAIGVGNALVEQGIFVPTDRAEEAKEIVAAFTHAHPEMDEGDAPPTVDEVETPPTRPLMMSRWVLVFVAILLLAGVLLFGL